MGAVDAPLAQVKSTNKSVLFQEFSVTCKQNNWQSKMTSWKLYIYIYFVPFEWIGLWFFAGHWSKRCFLRVNASSGSVSTKVWDTNIMESLQGPCSHGNMMIHMIHAYPESHFDNTLPLWNHVQVSGVISSLQSFCPHLDEIPEIFSTFWQKLHSSVVQLEFLGCRTLTWEVIASILRDGSSIII